MKSVSKETYHLLIFTAEEQTTFLSVFPVVLKNNAAHHLILDLSLFSEITANEMEALAIWSEKQQQGKKSFVIVNAQVNISTVPENLNVVPTVHEAADLIEMEEIQRDLGF